MMKCPDCGRLFQVRSRQGGRVYCAACGVERRRMASREYMRRRRLDDPTYEYKANEKRKKAIFEYYDYRGELEKQLLAAYNSPHFTFSDVMTYEQWRAWLSTPDGQAFLCLMQGHDDQYTEQRHDPAHD